LVDIECIRKRFIDDEYAISDHAIIEARKDGIVPRTVEKLEWVSGILNGRISISPEMAVRLSIAFDTTAQSWMNQQAQYDLWKAEQHRSELKVNRLSAASI